MIQDLYFIFGYSQIWLNLPREMIAHFFYIFQQMVITFPTTRIPKKSTPCLLH